MNQDLKHEIAKVMNQDLKHEIANDAETKMLDWLLQYDPARDLTVGDVKAIAAYVRALVFQAIIKIES